MVWMVVIPLFHIHPEGDRAHGSPSHVHGGVYHSVLSTDHSWEFHEHSHKKTADSHDHHAEHMKSLGSSTHDLDHPELVFSLLTRSLDGPKMFPVQAFRLVIPPEQEVFPTFSSFAVNHTGVPPPFWIFLSNHWFRPPPILSV